ncbi:MAG: universal stress protein [Deltaproteobacteria bacterium]|nr:universal stress protein [Deltaproteobacteria bacterium]
MTKKILVPTNFSDEDTSAYEFATSIALQNGASIVLLHVIEAIRDTSFEELAPFYKELEEKALGKIDVIVAEFQRKGLSCESVLVYGKRVDAIVQHAENTNVDLLIMRSHKIAAGEEENRLSDLLTISYKVAILSRCSILLIK